MNDTNLVTRHSSLDEQLLLELNQAQQLIQQFYATSTETPPLKLQDLQPFLSNSSFWYEINKKLTPQEKQNFPHLAGEPNHVCEHCGENNPRQLIILKKDNNEPNNPQHDIPQFEINDRTYIASFCKSCKQVTFITVQLILDTIVLTELENKLLKKTDKQTLLFVTLIIVILIILAFIFR